MYGAIHRQVLFEFILYMQKGPIRPLFLTAEGGKHHLDVVSLC
jgi:hypothetical protein